MMNPSIFANPTDARNFPSIDLDYLGSVKPHQKIYISNEGNLVIGGRVTKIRETLRSLVGLQNRANPITTEYLFIDFLQKEVLTRQIISKHISPIIKIAKHLGLTLGRKASEQAHPELKGLIDDAIELAADAHSLEQNPLRADYTTDFYAAHEDQILDRRRFGCLSPCIPYQHSPWLNPPAPTLYGRVKPFFDPSSTRQVPSPSPQFSAEDTIIPLKGRILTSEALLDYLHNHPLEEYLTKDPSNVGFENVMGYSFSSKENDGLAQWVYDIFLTGTCEIIDQKEVLNARLIGIEKLGFKNSFKVLSSLFRLANQAQHQTDLEINEREKWKNLAHLSANRLSGFFDDHRLTFQTEDIDDLTKFVFNKQEIDPYFLEHLKRLADLAKEKEPETKSYQKFVGATLGLAFLGAAFFAGYRYASRSIQPEQKQGQVEIRNTIIEKEVVKEIEVFRDGKTVIFREQQECPSIVASACPPCLDQTKSHHIVKPLTPPNPKPKDSDSDTEATSGWMGYLSHGSLLLIGAMLGAYIKGTPRTEQKIETQKDKSQYDEINNLRLQIETLLKEKERLEKELKNRETNEKNEVSEEVSGLKRNLEEKETEIRNLKSQISSLKDQLNAAEDKYNKELADLIALIADSHKEYDKLSKDALLKIKYFPELESSVQIIVDSDENLIPILNVKPNAKTDLVNFFNMLKARLFLFSELLDEIPKYQGTIQELKIEIMEMSRSIENLKAELHKHKNRQVITNEDTSYIHLQDLNTQLLTKIGNLEEEVRVLTGRIEEEEQKNQASQVSINKFRNQKIDLEKQLKELPSKIEEELNRIFERKTERLIEQLKEANLEIGALKLTSESLDQSLTALNGEYQSLILNSKNASKTMEEEIKALRTENETLEAAMRSFRGPNESDAEASDSETVDYLSRYIKYVWEHIKLDVTLYNQFFQSHTLLQSIRLIKESHLKNESSNNDLIE